MRLSLIRQEYRSDGIFSFLKDTEGGFKATTLEHAYEGLPDETGANGFRPKIPPGTYTCKRGLHKLHGMTEPFETFEILNVPGCIGILFHWGNFNKDSEGCVLVGREIAHGAQGEQMITESRATFHDLMQWLEGQDTFELIVA